MKFLAIENIPSSSIHLLRRTGHRVISILEEHPGMDDQAVLKRAIKDKSIILTFDRDYGELIFKYPKLIPDGLVYFRFDPATPDQPAMMLINIMKQKDINLLGHFTVIEEDRVRQRVL